MASKTLIGGTAYSIIGGKTLIDGTAYNIYSGKTLIGGTAYTINLRPQTLEGLLSSAVLKGSSGNNSSGTANTYVYLNTNGVYYAFSSLNGYLSITKLVRSGSSSNITKTVLKQTSTSYGNVCIDNGNCYYSNSGTKSDISRGTVSIVSFPGYTEAQADAILNTVTLTRRGGRNSGSSSTVSTSSSNLTGRIVYANYGDYFGFTKVTAYDNFKVLYGNRDANPSVLRFTSSNTYISTNGTSNASVYSGSITTLT